MSSKTTKKNVPVSKTNVITTRNKAAQRTRQLRTKTKIVEKPITKPSIRTTKSPKATKSETCRKDTPLQTKVRNLVKLVEQVEYYPEKLKRDLSSKKILLQPKHNFKVIASANKRKLTVPQKGGLKSPPLKRVRCNSSKSMKVKSGSKPEMSMADLVRLIEDNHTLSDEDFMEILTCPSPVWWEDPPDDGYIEDAICTRSADPSSTSTVNSTPEEQKNNKQTSKNKTKSRNTTKDDTLIDFEKEIQEFKISPTKNQSKQFNVKKQKLENILSCIKSGKNEGTSVKSEIINEGRRRKVSNSTDGEDFSDISFNEEELIKNLEDMDIPIEQSKEENKVNKQPKTVIETNIPIKDELIVPDKLPPLTRKPDFKVKTVNSENSDSTTEFCLDNVSHSDFRFITDDDLSIVDSSNGNEKVIIDKISINESSSTIDIDNIDKQDHTIKKELIDTTGTGNFENNTSLQKKLSDLSEYITVYKIVSQDDKNETNEIVKSPDNSNNVQQRGQLNSFFKKRKIVKRFKTCDSSVPAISVTDVKTEKENSDVQSVDNNENRLKPCDYCVVKTENGVKKFSCDKCEKKPIFSCNMCNFLADTTELYKKHVSSCKDVARISWQPNLLINQT